MEGRVGPVTEEWFMVIASKIPGIPKYHDRLGPVLLLKAKLTNLDTKRQCRQLMQCSLYRI